VVDNARETLEAGYEGDAVAEFPVSDVVPGGNILKCMVGVSRDTRVASPPGLIQTHLMNRLASLAGGTVGFG